jgi:hypothetical protein
MGKTNESRTVIVALMPLMVLQNIILYIKVTVNLNLEQPAVPATHCHCLH